MNNADPSLSDTLIGLADKDLLNICEKFKKFLSGDNIEGVIWTTWRVKKITDTSYAKSGCYDHQSFKLKEKQIRENQSSKPSTKRYLIGAIVDTCNYYHLDFDPNTKDFSVGKKPLIQTGELHFLVHYWHEQLIIKEDHEEEEKTREVDLGHIKIEIDRNGKACLATLQLYQHKAAEIPFNKVVSSESDVHHEENHLILRMRDETLSHILSQWVLYIGSQKPDSWNLLLGTYCSVGRKSSINQPLCGVLLLTKGDSEEAIFKKIKEKNIQPIIYHYLFKSRLNILAHNYTTFSTLPNKVDNEVKALKNYEGIYECLIVNSLNSDNILQRFVCKFESNSEAEVYIERRAVKENKLYPGRVRITENNSLICYFDQMDRKMHRFTFYIEGYTRYNSNDPNGIYLYGVYGKISSDSNKPAVGRIRFRLLTKNIKEKKIEEYSNTVKNILQKDPEFGEILNRDPDLKALLDGSHEVNHIDKLNSDEQTNKLNNLQEELKQKSARIQELEAKLAQLESRKTS